MVCVVNVNTDYESELIRYRVNGTGRKYWVGLELEPARGTN